MLENLGTNERGEVSYNEFFAYFRDLDAEDDLNASNFSTMSLC